MKNDSALPNGQYVLAGSFGYINFLAPPGTRFSLPLELAQRFFSIPNALWELQAYVKANKSTVSAHVSIERIVTKAVVQETTEVVA